MIIPFLSSHTIEIGIVSTGAFLVIALFLSHLLHRYIGISLFVVSLLLAFYFEYIDLIGVAASLVYGTACYKFDFKKKTKVNVALGFFIFIVSIGLLLHLTPGFYNPVVIDNVLVSANAPLYSQYMNIDKALVGFCLLMFVVSRPKMVSYDHYLIVIGAGSIVYAASFLIALTTGLVQLDIKFPDYLLLWCLVNLFITTYAEEAFFRGFVQKLIFDRIGFRKFGSVLTVILSGLLFGLAHFPGGLVYVLIATLLGCTYSFCYLRSKNILVPIVAHFLFNLIHFTVFTYPFISEV